MKSIALFFGVLALAFCGAAGAAQARTVITDPVAWVKTIYAGYEKNHDFAGPPDDIYSRRLAALFALDEAETPKGDVGRIDFDWAINAQDFEIKDVTVTGGPIQHGRQTVTAKFMNFDKHEEIVWYFEKEAGRWVLDDVRSAMGGEEGWTLSLILKYDWE